MASTFSQNLRLELIAPGSQSGVWGNTTNNNLGDLIEQAVSGATDLNVTSGDITLTALNGIVDQARSAVLSIVGSAGVTRTVTIPNDSKPYTVKNRSDATINLKTASGTAFEIPTLSEAYVYCDGDDVITGTVVAPLDSPTFTGTPTAPTASFGTDTTQIATTQFVQAALQAVFPVGSVYINAAATTNPATLFGFGTWTAIGAGRVLVGQDTGDALFNSLGETGGSKDATLVSHSHTTSGSGTTGNNNVGHFHGVNINSGNNNVGHVHSGSGNTSPENINHTHSGTTGNNNVAHTHGFSGGGATTSSVNLAHSHTGSTSTAGVHNHSVSDPGHDHNVRVSTGDQVGGNYVQQSDRLGSTLASTETATTGISIASAGSHAHSLSINSALGSHNHTVSISGSLGNNSVNHVHSFSTGTMSANAAHAHPFSFTTGTQSANHIHNVSGNTGTQSANHVHPFSFSGTTNTQGSSATNANIQPYLTVKMWQRTA